jgi:SAM-dependent methyltransferase
MTLPERYREPLRERFEARAAEGLAPGVQILDVGSGPRPALPPHLRPERCRYVALDVSAEELAAAPTGSFDEILIRSVTEHMPELDGCFDLVLSYHAFEHVKPLSRAVDNLRGYLRPGGRLVAMLSGSFSAFALANRVLPDRLGRALMERLIARDPETVFHSYYDGCWHGALERMLTPWSRVEIVPVYGGAEYFNFSPLLRRLYLRFENWAEREGHRNLATHYLLEAIR